MTGRHLEFLNNHCRVCCKRFGKSKYSCFRYPSILRHYGIDPSLDHIEIHPDSFCNSCYLTAKRDHESSTDSDRAIPVEWKPHDEISCTICDNRCKGGRPKKSSCGRPSQIHQHLGSVIANEIPRFKISQVVNDNLVQTVSCPS